MKQKDKELLLRDLCARLPYRIKVQYEGNIFDIDYISPMYEEVKLDIAEHYTIDISEIKPFLFPLSSMTEEEKKELLEISNFNSDIDEICDDFIMFIERTSIDIVDIVNFISYLNAHHFDYRGLIEKGLANDATGLNIY